MHRQSRIVGGWRVCLLTTWNVDFALADERERNRMQKNKMNLVL